MSQLDAPAARLRQLLIDVVDDLELPLTMHQATVLAQEIGRRTGVPQGPAPVLPERRMRVLTALAMGEPVGETARRLGIGEATVQSHRARLYKDLGVATGPQAVAVAYQCGLLQLAPMPAP